MSSKHVKTAALYVISAIFVAVGLYFVIKKTHIWPSQPQQCWAFCFYTCFRWTKFYS